MPLIPQKRERQVHEKMKIRNRKITVRLSEKERKFLGEQADAGGMKIEPYIRELIMGNDQIARNTNMGVEVTADILKEVLEMQKQIWERIKNL